MAITEKALAKLREEMIESQVKARGITHEALLEALTSVPRHKFVPERLWERAYEDCALPLAEGATISQPYVVAYMISLLEPLPEHKVLEVGTGSGYEAALLGKLCKHVYTIERDRDLSEQAAAVVDSLGIDNVSYKTGDGFAGWPEAGPFDRIIVSAAPAEIPRELVKELKLGGIMILPVGDEDQCLVKIEKTKDGLKSQELGEVRFVKMIKGEGDN